MKIRFAGEKSKAMCENCGLVSTTFAYRDVPLAQSGKIVKDILVGVCDQCSSVLSTPAQSTSAIRAEREREQISIEAVLPSPYIEVLDLACQKISTKASQEMRKRLLLFYVHQYATGELDWKDASQAYRDFLPLIPKDIALPKKRISLRVSRKMADEFDGVVIAANQSKTSTLKFIIAAIKTDVLDKNSELKALKTMALIEGY